MDYKGQNDHQRDWDRKAMGHFEMSIVKDMEEQTHQRHDTPSTFQETYLDEKASIVSMRQEEEVEDFTVVYPSTPRLIALCCGLAMIVFTVALDNTIIATAIPKITTTFNAVDDVGWYGASYLVTTTALQPTFGKVFQYFDVKWVYVSALVIFELGSVICAVASTSMILIVGRAVAGIGAAAIFSGSMTILGYSVPLEKRAIYLGIMSSMFGLASVVGPIMGGALTDNLSWRWCFWINLPFGTVSFVAICVFFKNPRLKNACKPLKQKIKEMDLVGSALFIGAIVCLLLALQWGGITYPWSEPKVMGCLIAFAIMFVLFLGIQYKLGDAAVMPPRVLVGNRTVATSAIFTMLFAMAMYTHIFYLPFYFQAVKGVSAEQSGINVIPFLIALTIAGICVGAFITLVGYYCPPLYVGSAIFCVGSGLLYTLTPESTSAQWIGYQIVAGFGVGMVVQVPFIAMQATLKEDDMPIGNAVAAFFNTFGGAIGLAIDQNIFATTLKQAVVDYLYDVNPFLLLKAGTTEIYEYIPAEQIPKVLFAYNYTITTVFIMPIAVTLAAFFVGFCMKWKSVKGQNLLAAVG
ncbi:hypothetical protein AMS68_007220 [Peltaster fructicola]|uniref:Major facilitator superfamily (MFS) profile domain-containing protein n=1 Tax=Peltaster fructicola TaxID=286661 RepID=A0A6H0Y3X6_9PEZI|nr:hypothetical protein AMS68_007220 [Peltaster fructicola]